MSWRALTILFIAFFLSSGHANAEVPDVVTTEGRPKYQFTVADEALLEEIQLGCFQYLWKEIGQPAQLVKDRVDVEVSSTAAVGFQLSALPIGVERGWITAEEGKQRALTVLRALESRTDNKKYGIYLHFVDRNTGGHYSKAPEVQFSTVDHALLAAGAIPAGVYFGGEVEELVNRLLADANWRAYAVAEKGLISFGWRAKDPSDIDGPGDFRPWKWWKASAEEQLVYFLAVGTAVEEHAVPPETYYKLERDVKRHKKMEPFVVSWNGSLFTYFFSQCWMDYRSFGADNPAEFGQNWPRVDWFENSRRATLTQRQRCIESAEQYATLAPNRWGLAPCMGLNEKGMKSYLVPGLRPNISNEDVFCKGTVAPYAAGTSIMFTPKESMDALRVFRNLRGKDGKIMAWKDPKSGGYGLADSFNLDQDHASFLHVGIDVGPMLLGIENARTGLIWRLFQQHPDAQRATERLKFKPL